MKEKRLKDGKKGGRKEGAIVRSGTEQEREGPWRPSKVGELRMVGRGKKESRYAVRKDGVEHHVFDPETCLHVGKHDGKIGVVFRFRTDAWFFRGYSDDYGTNVVRGLIPWDGEGGEKALRTAAALVAAKKARIARPPKWLLRELEKPGKWGRQEFWSQIVVAHREAVELGTIHDVMMS